MGALRLSLSGKMLSAEWAVSHRSRAALWPIIGEMVKSSDHGKPLHVLFVHMMLCVMTYLMNLADFKR